MYKCLPGTLDDASSHPRHLRATKTRDPRSNEVTTDTKLRNYDDYEFPCFFFVHFQTTTTDFFSYHILVRRRTNIINHHDCCRLACPIHLFFCCRPRPPKFSLAGGSRSPPSFLFTLIIIFSFITFSWIVGEPHVSAFSLSLFPRFEIWFGGGFFGDSIPVHRSRVLLRLGGVRSRQR